MVRFYKMDPILWDHGTTDLSLEEEAAYLRICNAIYRSERGCPMNDRVLAGMFRVSTRKARALVENLISKGKVFIRDGLIWNERADRELSSVVNSAAKSERNADEMPTKGKRNGREPDTKAIRNDREPPDKPLKDAELFEGKPPDDTPKTRLDKTRLEENKTTPSSLVEREFEGLWADYPRRLTDAGSLVKGSRQEAFALFRAMNEADRKSAIDGLPGFKRVYPDSSKGVCDCVRYLRHQRWRDVEGLAVKPKEGIVLPKTALASKINRLVGIVGIADYRAYFEENGHCLIESRGDGALIVAVNEFAREQIQKRFFNQLNAAFGFENWRVQSRGVAAA